MQIRRETLIEQIKKIVSGQILPDQRPEDVTDQVLSGLDSIGRLTLLVALENELGLELMGPDMDPDIFGALSRLADFVMKKTAE